MAEVVHGGLPYDVPQAWSKALSEHPKRVDGIAYHARHDDEALCYALFDRAHDALVETERRTDFDQDWFWRLAARYKVGVARLERLNAFLPRRGDRGGAANEIRRAG
jgi:hypothetical protein